MLWKRERQDTVTILRFIWIPVWIKRTIIIFSPAIFNKSRIPTGDSYLIQLPPAGFQNLSFKNGNVRWLRLGLLADQRGQPQISVRRFKPIVLQHGRDVRSHLDTFDGSDYERDDDDGAYKKSACNSKNIRHFSPLIRIKKQFAARFVQYH